MNDQTQTDSLDPQLQHLFTQAAEAEQLDETQFLRTMRAQIDQQYRRNILWRVGLGLLVVLAAMPIQDVVVALAPLFVTRIIDVPNQLVADLLAPINSIGSVITLALLGVRLTQKRLMDRLASS